MPDLTCFATAPRGFEPLLADELITLGAKNVTPARSGVRFEGALETTYRTCLWSRIAGRILLNLTTFPAPTPEALYDGIQTISWDEHLTPQKTLAVDCTSIQSNITHTRYAALKVKDAIVDQFRDTFGERPSVDTEHPDLSINVHIFRNNATLSLDLSGESLHRRNYRTNTLQAPLKENLAAALLLRARWPEIAAQNGALLDPMCGSGTLLIEAAFIAADIAPGLLRPTFGFSGWQQHNPALWEILVQEAQQRRQNGLQTLPPIVGYDKDPKAITVSIAHIENADLHGHIHVEKRDLSDATPPKSQTPGLLITNPPYGERLNQQKNLTGLYTHLGTLLQTHYPGWRAALFTGNPTLAPHLRLKPRRTYDLNNGAIKCKLLIYKLASDPSVYTQSTKQDHRGPRNRTRQHHPAQRAAEPHRHPQDEPPSPKREPS